MPVYEHGLEAAIAQVMIDHANNGQAFHGQDGAVLHGALREKTLSVGPAFSSM